MRRALRTWLLAVLGVGVLALIEPAVAAANPRCGSTLTHSVTLTANMVCRASDGLVVGRSRITINLNGHTIKAPAGTSPYYGIYNHRATA